MTATTARTRIEVLADEPLIPTIVRLAAEAGFTHHTLMPTLGGVGHAGRWRDDQLSGATAKLMFMAITSPETAQRFVDMITPLLETHGLLMMISEVDVVRSAHFG